MKTDKQPPKWFSSPLKAHKTSSDQPVFLKAFFTGKLKTMIRGEASPMLKLYKSVNKPVSAEADKTLTNAEPTGTEWFNNYE